MVSVLIQCHNCGREWVTTSTNARVSCAGCHASVKVPPPRIQVLAQKVPLETFCDKCGAVYAELSVCRTEIGDSLLLCERCTADLQPKEGEHGK